MANRYWVGGTANWDTTAGTKWATTSGAAGGAAVPTAADDVFFDAASGAVNITLTNSGVCRSLNCTGFTGTFTHNIGVSLSIGDTTAGASNVALKFVSGMTYTPAHGTSTIAFVSTSATQQTIDFAGRTTSAVTFSTAGNYLYTGSHNQNSGLGGLLTITRGTLDFNAQTCSLSGIVLTGTLARSVTFGAADITFGSTTPWTCTTVTNLTLSAASATFRVSTAGTSTFTHSGADTFGTAIFTGANPSVTAATATFGTFTHTGTAAKTCSMTLGSNITVSGTFTVNGNSAINRILIASSTIGTARTITAATVSCSNVDLRDITGAGAGSWNLSAITGNSGDCGGNTGITFTSPTTQTATGTASFTWSTHGWTTRVPLPQDTAVVSNAFIAGRTVTMDMPRVGTIDFTGSTGNVAFTVNTSTTNTEIYGHLTLRSGMGAVSFGTSAHLLFIGVSQQNLTMAGNSNTSAFNIYTDRSKLQLQDAYTATVASSGLISRFSGYFDTQSFNVQCALVWCQNASGINLFGSSTLTLTYVGAAAILDLFNATSARVSAASATFIVNGATSNTRTVALGGCSIGTLTYTVASSLGTMSITGGGTIGTLTVGSARTVNIQNGTTVTIGTALNASGTVSTLTGLSLDALTSYGTTPATAALQITSDVTLVAKVKMADWTPSVSKYFLGRWSGTAANCAYLLGINSTGRLDCYFERSTITAYQVSSTASVSFADNTSGWVAVAIDVDNGASGSTVTFWTSTDGITWTQLGSSVIAAGAFILNAGSGQALEFGVNKAGTIATENPLGEFHIGRVYSGSGFSAAGPSGTLVCNADFTTRQWGQDTFTETSSNAATITVVGSGLNDDGAARIRSTTSGSAGTLSKSSGVVNVTYVSLKDSTATGGATFNALDSKSISNNTGWNFLTANSGNFLQMF